MSVAKLKPIPSPVPMTERVDRAVENLLALEGFLKTTQADFDRAEKDLAALTLKFGSVLPDDKSLTCINGKTWQVLADPKSRVTVERRHRRAGA